MKNVVVGNIIVVLAAVVAGFLPAGCEPQSLNSSYSPKVDESVFAAYSAVDIHITGLTEIVPVSEGPYAWTIRAYVDLLDSSGSRIKYPGTFRFELYNFVPRSAQPMGRRLFVWPDLDLSKAAENNTYWRDYLRAYELNLDVNLSGSGGDTFILQATFITPAGKRLSDTFGLEFSD